MRAEIESLLQENHELRRLLDQSNNRINDFSSLRNKIHQLDEALKKEKTEKEKIEGYNYQLSQRMKENELKMMAEFSKMKNYVVSKEEEMENLRIKYENKINKVP